LERLHLGVSMIDEEDTEDETLSEHVKEADQSAALWKSANSHERQLIILCAFLERLAVMLSDRLSTESISLIRTLYEEIRLLRKAEEPKILKKLGPSKHLSLKEQRNRALLLLGYEILIAAGSTETETLNRLCEAAKKFDLLPRENRRNSAPHKKRLQQALNNIRSKARSSQNDYCQARHTYVLEKCYMKYVQVTTQCSLEKLAQFYLNNYLPYTLNLRKDEPEWPGEILRARGKSIQLNPNEEWGKW
jgi:hypothetical protein